LFVLTTQTKHQNKDLHRQFSVLFWQFTALP